MNDSEGWIIFSGNECPLPEGCMFEWRSHNDDVYTTSTHGMYWSAFVTHYRPILEQAEPIPTVPQPSLFEQLAAAHEAAAKIPDIIAQIKATLERYGHTVVPMNPFVEPEAAVEPDMTDWRNWREGDLLLCLTDLDDGLRDGDLYEIVKKGIESCVQDDDGDYRPLTINAYRFRFHSHLLRGE
jgi:hypothetical protein